MSSAWERFKAIIFKLKKKRKRQIMIFGLEKQGKSWILDALAMHLKGVRDPPMLPVPWYDVVTVKGISIMAWRGRLGTPVCLRKGLFCSFLDKTDALWCCVDSTNREKVVETGKELNKMLRVFSCLPVEGFPVAILATKQDLVSSCMSVSEVEEIMNVGPSKGIFNMQYFGVSGATGEGLVDAFEWSAKVAGKGKLHPKEVLERWLDVEDENDDEFLERVFSCELMEWNHRTYLRIIWLCLKREGWKRGVESIFSAMKDFTNDGPHRFWCCGSSSGTPDFHATRMHFWNHMVHFAIENAGGGTTDFKSLLLLNPQLSNEGLIHYYYTDDLMLSSPEAQTTVFLPNKRPLPSVGDDVNEVHVIEQVNQLLRSLMESQTTNEGVMEGHHNVGLIEV